MLINNKYNQQYLVVTLIDTRFLSHLFLVTFVKLISIKSAPVLSASGDNFREENEKKNWSERFLLKVYIVVCYFSLIIFSTVELTS